LSGFQNENGGAMAGETALGWPKKMVLQFAQVRFVGHRLKIGKATAKIVD
jgi:hypothetical protein